MVNKITSPITPLGEIDKINEVIDEVDKKLDKSGGTMTGNLSVNNAASITTNGYVVGTWLQTKSASVNNNLTTVAMLDGNGWIYKQSKDTLLSGAVKSVNNTSPDSNGNVTISIPTAVTESTVSGWGFTKNAGTVTSVNNISPTNGNVTLSIPAAQVQSNWNETSTSSKAYIQNKPTIPTVNNATLTITQGGTTKGTFTANASSDVTIALDAGGSGTTEYVRNIGEIVTSTIPLTDAGLHLLDGALLQYASYKDFIDYIASIYNANSNYFCSESDWQTSVTNYGVCGKFVYNSTNNTVRLPKITGFTEGAIDATTLGDLTEAGLPVPPNHTHTFSRPKGDQSWSSGSATNSWWGSSNSVTVTVSNPNWSADNIYGNSTTVQPQSVKVLYYIVVATTTKTEIEVDIDEIATDLNGKADTDGSNMVSSVKNFDGQWVSSFLQIANTVTWKTNTAEATYSLANYLPNDNYNYEVLIIGTAATGSTSGNFVTIGLNSDLIDNSEIIAICEARTRTAAQIESRSNAIIPIGTGRWIKQYSSSSNNANGTYSLWALAYRRIGTNS